MLLRGKYVLTMNTEKQLCFKENYAVLVKGSVIRAVGPFAELLRRNPDEEIG